MVASGWIARGLAWLAWMAWMACGLLYAGRDVAQQPRPEPNVSVFMQPQRVLIDGYAEDAMEPFLSRDGRYLFFNSRNEPPVNTDLYWAVPSPGGEGSDGLHFRYRGPLRGVNTTALDAVASMDRGGNFFFVSNRSYDQTASTLYEGKFSEGEVRDVRLVPGVSVGRHGIVNFDAEISAEGDTLYFVESQFDFLGGPRWARILAAGRHGDTFVREDRGVAILATVNAEGLNYAPATSASGCEIFWTRVLPGHEPAIYAASRNNANGPFGVAERIAAITGFAEAPTLSPDGRALYYHLQQDGHLVLYRVTRAAARLCSR